MFCIVYLLKLFNKEGRRIIPVLNESPCIIVKVLAAGQLSSYFHCKTRGVNYPDNKEKRIKYIEFSEL